MPEDPDPRKRRALARPRSLCFGDGSLKLQLGTLLVQIQCSEQYLESQLPTIWSNFQSIMGYFGV